MPAPSIAAGLLRLIAVIVAAYASVGCQATRPVAPTELSRQRLNVPIFCDFKEARFEDVIARFRETSGLNIVVSWRTIQDGFGMGKAAPITIEHFSGPMKGALRLAFRQIDGGKADDPLDAYIDDDGIVLIFRRSEIYTYTLIACIYDVADLCDKFRDDDVTDTEAIRLAITKCALRRESWDTYGGSANTILLAGKKAFIRASNEEHERIRQVLAALRAPPASPPIWFRNDPYDGFGIEARPDASQSAKEELRAPISCNFEATRLNNVIDFFSKATGVKIAPDWKILNDLNVSEDTAVTLKLSGAPADDAIKLMVDQLPVVDPYIPLRMSLEGDTLVITSRQELRRPEDIGICDISDFLDYKPQDPPNVRVNALMEAITRFVGKPEEWENSGAGASHLAVIRNKMIIQTYPGQRLAIETILAAFRAPPGGPLIILDNHD